ncbi:MAG: SH3 domain-containing protein [Helicobacter trogontum]|uniref:SH3 domain-containing protein n=1 Tax=Helicobacter trogontum TaxID=50960 RepID=A0A4U8TIH2_9HELI|nr:SH3 domain-containing protein [Helicobacter trogontum]MCI5787511.1 SH3 domain-containing protein [Helicobacter trogontum]TLD98557.1 hypothetical protein LS80_004450 [Helicobacter trogontum]
MNSFIKTLTTLCVCLALLKAQEGININILSGTKNLHTFNSIESMPFQTQSLDTTIKEEYLSKFYAVWDINRVNSNTDSIFYIVPSLQNALNYNKELEELKKKPPKKGIKNYAKAEREYSAKITSLKQKINALLGIGENLMPNTLEEFEQILSNMNLQDFLRKPRAGIIVQATSVRAVPTNKPRYKSKDDFPFDRWQNSFIFEGTPVMISHFSSDGRYAHIQGPFVYGWVDTRSVGLVSDSMRKKILSFESYKIPNKDFVPLSYQNQWVLDARVGQVFPYNKRHNTLVTFYKDVDNYVQIREVNFDSNLFSDFPMPFSEEKMSLLIHTMLGQKYGWGGLFGNRDCSAFTRDSFASFGIFLPRNSAAQAQFKGQFIDISKMTENEKEEYIIAHARPFASIIWLKGHIMLYMGHVNIKGTQRAIVAHSAWNVKPIINNKQENIKLGGVHITTLHIGGAFSSNTAIKNTLLSRVEGLTNIYDGTTNPEALGLLSSINISY